MYGISPNSFWETSSAVSDMICNLTPVKPPNILVGDSIYILAYDYIGLFRCKSVSNVTSVLRSLASNTAVDTIKLFP
jgi:hypothetical protein